MAATPAQNDALNGLIKGIKATASPFRTYLAEVYDRYKDLNTGKVADYIPELAKANPKGFGVAVCTPDGRLFEVGDTTQRFTIQSVSKPFVFSLALEDMGREETLKSVGVEPTGDAFNSLIKLGEGTGKPHNPMVNAGAIACAGLIKGADPTDRFNRILEHFSKFTGQPINVDMSVFTSERSTGHRNRAIAHLMLNFGMIDDDVDAILDLYFKQCSILCTARDLAVMGATLANKGQNPLTGVQALAPDYVKDVLSVMLTCGMYDYAGEWAYSVGIPAKSGVGGGICAAVPGKLGIGIYSPAVDSKGNSVRGIAVCRDLSRELRLHVLDAVDSTKLDDLLNGRARGG